MRALIGLPVLDFPTPYARMPTATCRRASPRATRGSTSEVCLCTGPACSYTVGDSSWEKIVVYGRQLDLPIQKHLAGDAERAQQSLRAHAMSPLARLDRLGVTGPNFIAVHAVHLRDSDVELLAAQSCHVVHCPGSNLKLASGIAPVVRLKARGVNVALGSDGAASNNRLDVLGEARLAALVAKVATGDAAALPAAPRLAWRARWRAVLGSIRRVRSLPASSRCIAVNLAAFQHAPCYIRFRTLLSPAATGNRRVDRRKAHRVRRRASAPRPRNSPARARLWQTHE